MSEPQIVPVYWRYVGDGWQLSSGLWWVAFVGEQSESHSGWAWWRLSGDKTTHYCRTANEARIECELAATTMIEHLHGGPVRYRVDRWVQNQLDKLADALGRA